MDLTKDREILEKSFSDSRTTLLAMLGEEDAALIKSDAEQLDELLKAQSTKSEGKEKTLFDGDAEDDDDDDDDDDEGAGKVKKSLPDLVSENPDAATAMDVEPFLKSLVDSIGTHIDNHFALYDKKLSKLAKSVTAGVELQKAQSRMMLSTGELQKSVSDTIEKFANEPLPSTSLKKSAQDRFPASVKTVGDLSNDQIMEKAQKLKDEGKLKTVDLTKIEGRLNKGITLGEYAEKIEGDK